MCAFICLDLQESKFLVKTQRTDDSSLHRLDGEYYMFVSDTEICLRKSPQITPEGTAISWPLQNIRKLKSEATTDGLGDLITLVASRLATTALSSSVYGYIFE